MMRCFRYRGHKPCFDRKIFYNQEEAIERLESLWECFRDLAHELGKKDLDGGKMELVLTRLPDAATCAEEQREHKVAQGWPYEEVYGTAPPDTWTDEEGNDTEPAGPEAADADAMDTT